MVGKTVISGFSKLWGWFTSSFDSLDDKGEDTAGRWLLQTWRCELVQTLVTPSVTLGVHRWKSACILPCGWRAATLVSYIHWGCEKLFSLVSGYKTIEIKNINLHKLPTPEALKVPDKWLGFLLDLVLDDCKLSWVKFNLHFRQNILIWPRVLMQSDWSVPMKSYET